MAGKTNEANDKITFSFGRNWQSFVARHLDSERQQISSESLTDFLRRKDLVGLSFLDVGCGSGLFSLAACKLGARRIVSLDVDPYSVECTKHLRDSFDAPNHWTVMHGSILDDEILKQIQPADIVYAWGSLHHTGRMWDAIRNTCRLVAPNGLFYLGIYNRVEGRGSSGHWLKVKRFYNRSSNWMKHFLEIAYILRHQTIPNLVRGKNPFRIWRDYHKMRGMDMWTDVRDWLGGYPYEFAGVDEVFRFCTQELGLTLVNLKCSGNLGVNEFLFYRPEQMQSATAGVLVGLRSDLSDKGV